MDKIYIFLKWTLLAVFCFVVLGAPLTQFYVYDGVIGLAFGIFVMVSSSIVAYSLYRWTARFEKD